ncbi:glycosyltransferase [Psychrobacter sp. JB385]|uniref:glycosyltransferase n=1 Tax=Psychrobacter sp. JB385 TaxID=1434841 RepID=UPI00097EC58B|nr:glycosyltransferase [Psychrobacter sp. JB385]SJN38455.1 Alpha-1,4-N-acetylgalactosamine transferase PglJ [Psychrobacter sp. JB385]
MPATILFILKALEGRGAERMVTTLASAYVKMGHSVHILCLEHTQDMSLDAGIHYHVVPYDKVFSPQNMAPSSTQSADYRTIAQRVDNYILSQIGTPDLILANIYKINWIMAYSQLPNIVNVLHTALSKQFEHQLSDKPLQAISHLRMVYGAHPCSCVSEGARKDLKSLLGDITKTATIYNPCDVAWIQSKASQKPHIEQFGLADKQYIIHVASFDTMKGHRDLLQAYAKTERKLPLVLVGKGKLEAEIKALALELDISDDVKFLGFQTNPYSIIASAALMVLTSKFEGFGYVIVEAQALGVPMISTDCPFGPRELLPVKNLIPVGNIEGLAILIDQAVDDLTNYIVPLNQQLLPNHIAQQYLEFGVALNSSVKND